MIIIVDYGMGNLGSIVNMLKKVGQRAVVTSEPSIINQAKKLILPGVGAFDNGVKSLQERGLVNLLNDKVLHEQIPILGLCLGMQLFARRSEEGVLPGLGWIEADVVRFKSTAAYPNLKVPAIGWNYLDIQQPSSLLENLGEEPRFYFVHSYYLQCDHPEDILATAQYGCDATAVIRHNNIYGTQFHPEKSHRFGMQLLRNFVERI